VISQLNKRGQRVEKSDSLRGKNKKLSVADTPEMQGTSFFEWEKRKKKVTFWVGSHYSSSVCDRTARTQKGTPAIRVGVVMAELRKVKGGEGK